MKHLPNILTGLRLALSLVVFLALAALGLPSLLAWAQQAGVSADRSLLFLYYIAFFGFIVAAVTDFFDGWLARKYNVTSLMGAILDPIADKVLVAGAVVGMALAGSWIVGLTGGLMLFREFAVSALRETLAPRGLKLPVTLLAKWKTTLQLLALGAQMFIGGWTAWGLPHDEKLASMARLGTLTLLWVALGVTWWTGVEYALAARKALAAQKA
jgi:CDP-diacylglycerol--glycerol-3-phosphate 3-phosphatidyltransferase